MTPETLFTLARLTARCMSSPDCRLDTRTIQAEVDGVLVLTVDETATANILFQGWTSDPETQENQTMKDDSQAAIEYQYAQAHDPNCPTCHGEGYYHEDVCGDGGPQMMVECECERSDPLIAALEANPTVTAAYMQRTRNEQANEMWMEQDDL